MKDLGSVGQGCLNVVPNELRVSFEDFFRSHPIGQATDDHADGNASAFDARLSVLTLRVDPHSLLPRRSSHRTFSETGRLSVRPSQTYYTDEHGTLKKVRLASAPQRRRRR